MCGIEEVMIHGSILLTLLALGFRDTGMLMSWAKLTDNSKNGQACALNSKRQR
jgi:hypothetical protein